MAASAIPAFVFQPAAVLRFSGEDHAAFLQGQGTRDLRGPAGFCRYSLWLDHRGVIRGDGFVLRLDAARALLVSYASAATTLGDTFRRHIIADDVVIEDHTAGHVLAAIAPEHAGGLLAHLGTPAPGPDAFIRAGDFLLFPGRRLGPGSLDLLAPATAILPVAATVTQEHAEWLRIRAGMPLVPRDTAGLNPVEAGLLGTVSFTKGCYLGQEVVARVHRLQRAGRRMVRVEGAGAAPATPAPLLREGAPVGMLTSAVAASGGFLGIGWLKSKIADGHQLLDGLACVVGSLPPS